MPLNMCYKKIKINHSCSLSRRAAGVHGVLYPDRHVGGGLHFLRDVLRPASLPRGHRGGPTSFDIQGRPGRGTFLAYNREKLYSVLQVMLLDKFFSIVIYVCNEK